MINIIYLRISSVVIVLFILLLSVLLILPSIRTAYEIDTDVSCQNVLRQWGQVFLMYSSESSGNVFPPLHVVNMSDEAFPDKNDCLEVLWVPQYDFVYPEYMTDPFMALCPSNERDCSNIMINVDGYHLSEKESHELYVRNSSYFYTGWFYDNLKYEPLLKTVVCENIYRYLADDEYVNAQLAMGIESLLRSLSDEKATDKLGLHFLEIANAPLNVPIPFGNDRHDILHRLREGCERTFVTDINSRTATNKIKEKMWVMMDMYEKVGETFSFYHTPIGSNVLYIDGSVKFVPFVGKPKGLDMDSNAKEPVLPSLSSLFSFISHNRLLAEIKLRN